MEKKTGVDLIAAERSRQISKEGWSADHDDEHTDASLALAAVCYAAPERLYIIRNHAAGPCFYDPWPDSWDSKWDKRYGYGSGRRTHGNYPPSPQTYTRKERLDLLVKAGALIAAEIDRLLRIQKKTKSGR